VNAEGEPNPLAADIVLVLHFAVVVLVVGGLAAVFIGNLRRWRWVNAAGFRLAHAGAIAVVVAESWLGITCPLTTLEARLRAAAGGPGGSPGFIEVWLARVLFYEAPPWVFVVGYTVFGVLVALAWWRFPPRRRESRRNT
jgi:hypothetical protein